ncbi:MAG: thioredoxin family protein [Bacteroidota bacterium]
MRFCIFSFVLLFSFALSSQGIEFFHGSWEEALEIAQQEDKPIFVDAYASWCGPCKRMAANVFPQSKVGEVFNANFINMKLDMEKPEAAKFRVNHPVRAYPTLFFLSPDGETIHKVVGGQRVDGLIAQARTALSKVDNIEKYQVRYEEGDRDPDFVFKYVRALIRQGEPHLKVANDQLRNQKDQLNEPGNLRLMLLAATDADSRIFDMLLDNREAITALVSNEAFDKQVKLAFNNTLAKAVKFEDEKLLATTAKKYQGLDAKEGTAFLLKGQLEMAQNGVDAKAYYKAAKKYHSKSATGNAKPMADLFQQMSGSKFADDTKVQTLTEKVGLESAELNNHYRNYYLLAKWLLDVDRKEAALSAAEKAKTLVPEKEPNTLRLIDFLINRIKE